MLHQCSDLHWPNVGDMHCAN